MSTQPLKMANASTRSVLANITADQLQNTSPCASWDVAGIINHIIAGQGFFVAGLTGQPASREEVDHSAGDFLTAYDAATQAAVDCFEADGALDGMVKMPFGEMPGRAVLSLAMTDTFTHGWDIAKATGQSTDLAPELAAQLRLGPDPKRNLSWGIALAIPTGELRLLQPRIEIIGSKLPMDDWSSSSGRRYLSGNVLRTDGVQPVASAA